MNIQDTVQVITLGYFLVLGLLAIAIAILIYTHRMSKKSK